jgi:hypothetical protein
VLKIKAKTAKDETPRAIFQLNKNANLSGYPATYPMHQAPANNEILSRLAAIESKLDEEDFEEEETQPTTPGSIIAGLLEKPEIINGITNFIMNIAGNLTTPKIKAVAGINEDINDILKTLYSKGVKVEHLKKLSEMPEAKIQMLISML